MAKNLLDSSVYSLMQTGKPYKSYIKTILGKVYVTVLNPFTGEPEGKIIKGNPKGKDKDDCIVDFWSEIEDAFFRRMNKRHLEAGELIPYTRKEEAVSERSPNDLTEEELDELLTSRFMTLQHRVNRMTSVSPVFRLIERARELEKSEKIIKFLEGKLSELQLQDYGSVE